MKNWILPALLAFLLAGCAAQPAPAGAETASEVPAMTETIPETIPETNPQPTAAPDPAEAMLAEMTEEELVGQLFLARFPGEAAAREHAGQYHLGGYILFGRDFEGQTPDTLRDTLRRCQDAAAIPMLLAVDEEGGTVCRVSRYPAFCEEMFPSPRELYDRGGLEAVLETEAEKATLLHSLGLNVNMAPVCDIAQQPGSFMYRRSLGQDPEITGSFVTGAVSKMAEHRVGAVLKHFPGYGENADTHTGIAVDSRSLEQLEGWDLLPFAAGIRSGCGAILVSHTIVQAMDAQLPATLSPAVHACLRETMGFAGVIVTDDLSMQAITDSYGAGEAAVLAVLAGNDLLCATDYPVQYAAVLEAVQTGRISRSLLEQAALRVLQWKQSLGLFEQMGMKG